MRKTPLLPELHRATQCIPTITPTTTYCHSARRMSCGAQRGGESLVMLIHGEGEDEPQSNWAEVYRSHRWGPGITAKRNCEKREDEIVFLFYELKKKRKQDLRKNRRERRWKIGRSYKLCSSYTLVSNEWNRLSKVKKKCSRSKKCLIVL